MMSQRNDSGPSSPIRGRGGADIMTYGFGITVSMWTVGYFCRIPNMVAPAPLVLVLLLACLATGGYFAGRHTDRGWKGGLWAGMLSGALNLLVLGSLLAGDEPNKVIANAPLWISGFVGGSAAIGAAAGAAGARRGRIGELRCWTGSLARVAAGATFLLIVAGGVVTSQEAGLAVVDWPNTERYNMFLYPLARMTGGIYFEHAHRLIGSLTGLTILVFTAHLWQVDRRSWTRWIATATLFAVIVQGILGGLRVTGVFTFSADPSDTAPNLTLAIVHGVFGQMIFAAIVALAAFTSDAWLQRDPPEPRRSAPTDRMLGILTGALLVTQLTIGAILRHRAELLLLHVTMAIVTLAFVTMLGLRAWGLYPEIRRLSRLGAWLTILGLAQLLLGLGALIVTWGVIGQREVVPVTETIIATAHQAVGALLLALATGLTCFLYRLVATEQENGGNSVDRD